MKNLDEVISAYVSITFSPQAQFTIYHAFELANLFNLKYIEDKFINLLATESIDSAEKQDTFSTMIVSSIVEIIETHGIKLVPNVSLSQANEVLSGLYLIQNLEDYSLVQYQLSSNADPIDTLCRVMGTITHFNTHDYLSIIDSVSDGFLVALREYVEGQVTSESYNPDQIHKETVTAYFKFLGGAETFGASLLREGFTLDNTLTQLVSLGNMALPADLDKLVVSNPIQAALEIVTFLILAKDTYQIPLVGFNKNTSTFLTKMEDLTKITPIIIKIINDFNSYHFSLKSAQQHEKNTVKTEGETS